MKFEGKQKYNDDYDDDNNNNNNKCDFTCPRVTRKRLVELTDSNLF
jgi:hypothetical protein